MCEAVSSPPVSGSGAESLSSIAGGVLFAYSGSIGSVHAISGNSIQFVDCEFVNNSAVSTGDEGESELNAAGAVNVHMNAENLNGVIGNTITFTRCVFTGNGGATVVQLPPPGMDFGTSTGAVAVSWFGHDIGSVGTGNVSNNALTFDACVFRGNSGGGVQSNGAGALGVMITTAGMSSNNRPATGAYNNSITITDTVFDSNSAVYAPPGGGADLGTGGAGAIGVYAAAGALVSQSIVFVNSSFLHNTGRQPYIGAGDVGVAPVIAAAGAVSIQLRAISSSRTRIAVSGGSSFVGNVIFDSDGSQLSAGAMALYDLAQYVTHATVAVSDTRFDSQIGGNGVATGAGAWSYRWDEVLPGGSITASYAHNSFTFRRCEFSQNAGGWATETQDQPAGAAAVSVYLSAIGHGDATSGNDWLFESCVFGNNTSASPPLARATTDASEPDMESGSGAIYFGCSVNANVYRVTIRDSTFTGNRGLCGALSINTGTYHADTASSALRVVNSTFLENSSPCDTCNGGAICVQSSPFAIANSSFVANSAGYAGGALDLGFGATGTLRGVAFSGHIAAVASEIISVASDQSLTIAGSVFTIAVPDSALSFVTTMSVPTDTNVTDRTVIRCPPGYSAFAAGRLRGCQVCTAQTYSIHGGVVVDANVASANCSKCPFGAVCNGGADVAAVSGYWGSPESNNQSFVACQPGFCCADSNTCAFTDICRSDVTHRTGTLCSTCASGYSEVYGSVNCRLSANCHDGGWFIAVSLIASAIIACVYFYSDPSNDGLISTVIYYYQMVPFVVSTGSLDAVSSTLANAFNFRFHSDSGVGVCPFPDISPIGKRLFSLLLIGWIGPTLFLIWFIHSRGWACDDRIRRSFRRVREWFAVRCCCRTEAPLLAASDASEPWLDRASSPDAPARAPVKSQPELTRDRISAAVTKFVLYSYSAVAQVLFLLLQCVNVSPAGSDAATPTARLFIDPDAVACYTDWQRGLFVVTAIVLLAPLLLLLWTSRASSQGSASAVLVVLSSPFHTHAAYWESLRLIWRLSLVAVSTFVLSAVPRSLTVGVISMGMLTLHVYVQPMKDSWTQRIGVMTLVSLSVLSEFNVSPATTVDNTSPANDQLSATFDTLTALRTAVLLIPAIVGAIVIVRRQIADCCRASTDPEWQAPSVVVDRSAAINRPSRSGAAEQLQL